MVRADAVRGQVLVVPVGWLVLLLVLDGLLAMSLRGSANPGGSPSMAALGALVLWLGVHLGMLAMIKRVRRRQDGFEVQSLFGRRRVPRDAWMNIRGASHGVFVTLQWERLHSVQLVHLTFGGLRRAVPVAQTIAEVLGIPFDPRGTEAWKAAQRVAGGQGLPDMERSADAGAGRDAERAGPGPIDDPQSATRLAEALMADLERAGATEQASEVDEARAIFHSRVTSALHPIFEQVLSSRRAG